MARKAHLLLIDDDPNTLASLARAFRLAGHEATVCDNANRAAELVRGERFDLILSDVVMPGKTGMDLLEELKKAGLQTPIVLISGQANIEMAVKATRLGALDFLEKPLSTDKLLLTVENALKLSRLEDENRELRHRLGKHELVGSGPAMKKLLAQIERRRLDNIRIFANDARLIIAALQPSSIDRVFILFPDPWPKRRHEKRRFVSRETLDTLAAIMTDGAELRLATDDGNYLSWMLERITEHPFFEWLVRGPRDWRTRPEDWPPTRYEEKARAAGRAPTFLRLRRRFRK